MRHDPRSHEGEPRLSLLFQSFVANQRIRALLAEAMADASIRADEFAVYSLVLETGPITPTDMARILGMPLTTLSDYTRTMVERGHARRRPNPVDQRSYLLELTRQGVAAHAGAYRLFVRAKVPLDRSIEALGGDLEEIEAAVRLLGLAAERTLGQLVDGVDGPPPRSG
jgi:DNA-binding MarR family transcriptional regulator